MSNQKSNHEDDKGKSIGSFGLVIACVLLVLYVAVNLHIELRAKNLRESSSNKKVSAEIVKK
ncbi:MAG: hypothetical protein ACD_8C00012G0010 [uncultured bacterium]|nr:MAG: hypothetical protein ACD_8C00012G0010 [uncultured bacterium]